MVNRKIEECKNVKREVKLKWEDLDLPCRPYSIDLLPIDPHILRSLDKFLKEKCLRGHEYIENAFQQFPNLTNPNIRARGIYKLTRITLVKVWWT